MTVPFLQDLDPLEELKAMRDDPLAELQAMRKRPAVRGAAPDATRALPRDRADATGDFEATVPSVLGVAAAPLRDIPGGEAVQAAVRAALRGESYRQARQDIHNAVDEAPAAATVPSRLAGTLLAGAVLPGSPAVQGATYGAAHAIGNADPDRGIESRLWGAAIEGAMGGAGGGVLSLAGKLKNAPPGTVKKVAGALLPRSVQRAARVWQSARKAIETGAEEVIPKAEGFVGNTTDNLVDAARAVEPGPAPSRKVLSLEDRLASVIAPAERPNVAEGFVGNGMENLRDAGSVGGIGPATQDPLYRQLEDILAQAQPEQPSFIRGAISDLSDAPKELRPRPAPGATKARFAYWADRLAQRNAEQAANASADIADVPLEDLLGLTAEHVKKGGTLKSAADALRIVRRP